MSMDYEDILNSENPLEFFSRLTSLSKEHFMELLYRALIDHRMGALEDDETPKEKKIEAIHILIKWFEEREEYEKCHKLKNMIQLV